MGAYPVHPNALPAVPRAVTHPPKKPSATPSAMITTIRWARFSRRGTFTRTACQVGEFLASWYEPRCR